MEKRISLYTPPFYGTNSYLEMVDICKKYNLDLETINYFELTEPDFEFAKKLRKYADERNVKISCCSCSVNLVGDDVDAMKKRAKKFIDIAYILGSPYFHHTVAVDIRNPDTVLKNRDIYIKRGVEAIAELYDYAKESGIVTLHEPQGYIFNGLDGIGAIKESQRETKVVADFGNILFVDEKIEDFIPKFADKIVNVHLKDYIVLPEGEYEKEKRCQLSVKRNALVDCPLGEGVVDFDRGFAELEKIGYDGHFALECVPVGDDVATFEKNLEFIKKRIS